MTQSNKMLVHFNSESNDDQSGKGFRVCFQQSKLAVLFYKELGVALNILNCDEEELKCTTVLISLTFTVPALMGFNY